MSIIKLAFAITLSVVPVILSFVEPAAAQRRLRTNTYSQTSSDQLFVFLQFNLVDTARDGSAITDTASDLRLGLFPGAIQDYVEGSGRLSVLDESGFPIFNPDSPFVPNSGVMPFDADLRAEFIENDPAFEFFGGIRDSIAYSIIRPGEDEPVFSYRLDFARFGFDQNESINNLSYILEQNVLGRASRSFTFPDGSIQLIGGDALLQNRVERDIPNAVPEPSATLGALAAVSIGVLFKQKKKQL